MILLKKTVYEKLVAKVNRINTSGLVLKPKFDTDKSDLEKKTSDQTKNFWYYWICQNTDYNTKSTEIESKIVVLV